MTAKGSVTPWMACGSRPVKDDPEHGAFPAVGIHQGQGLRGHGLMPPYRPRQAAGWQIPQADSGRNGPIGIDCSTNRPAPKTAGFAQLSPPYGATGAARSRRLLRVWAKRTSAPKPANSNSSYTKPLNGQAVERGALCLQAVGLKGSAQPLGGGAERVGAVPSQLDGELGDGRERLIRQAHHLAAGQGFGE